LRDDLALTAWRLFVLCVLVPIGAGLLYGALYSVGWAGLLSEGFTLRYWRNSLGDAALARSLGLSLAVAAAVTAIAIPAALAIALGRRGAHARGPLGAVVTLPLAIPASVAAFVSLQVLAPGWVHDPWAAGIVLTHAALAVPFFVLIYTRLLETERIDALETLARSLGAGRGSVLRCVTVPILLKRSLGNIILLFIVVLGSYEVPLLLGRQSPEMLSVFTLRKFTLYDIGRKPEAYVAAMLYTALAGVLVSLAFRKAPETSVRPEERGTQGGATA
jgi:putative spermidine/putrescine transport system permease protein